MPDQMESLNALKMVNIEAVKRQIQEHCGCGDENVTDFDKLILFLERSIDCGRLTSNRPVKGDRLKQDKEILDVVLFAPILRTGKKLKKDDRRQMHRVISNDPEEVTVLFVSLAQMVNDDRGVDYNVGIGHWLMSSRTLSMC